MDMINLHECLSEAECRQISARIQQQPTDPCYVVLNTDDEGSITGLSDISLQHPSPMPDLLIACYGNEDHDGILLDADLTIHISDVAKIQIDAEKIQKELSADSTLEQHIPGFTVREGQKEMAALVTNAFNHGNVLSVEAGTGTGKSLAYLIPAIRYAEHNQTVVIATATIALQQQLVEKDIPMLQKALHTDLKVVLAKGKNNYLCRQKISDVQEDLFDEKVDARMQKWMETTETGDRSELPGKVDESHWQMVASDFDTCLTHRCQRKDLCFVRKARRKLLQADLVITNHHLLLHDLEIRQLQKNYISPIALPPFRNLIVDESHGLEHSMVSVFTEKMSLPIIEYLLKRIYVEGKKRPRGLLARARKYFSTDQISRTRNYLSTVKKQASLLSDRGTQLLGEQDSLLLLPEEIPAGWDLVVDAFENLKLSFAELSGMLKSLLAHIDPHDEDDALLCQSQLRKMQRNIAAFLRLIRFFQEEWRTSMQVCWVQRAGKIAVFQTAPLDVAPMVQELITEPMRTAIYTSATLTVNKRFDYWNKRMGLPDQKAVSIASPFHYQDQVLLAIPTDAPFISRDNQHDYVTYLANLIHEGVCRSRGGALVLFTSYRMMDQCFSAMPSLKDISLYKQGDMDRGRLLEHFRDDTHSVLFATASFWEGVDVPGDSLRLLIICQLPFVVPTNPIPRARSAALEVKGKSAFMDYMLPEAVIRLRQGFGRLIRSDYDSGVVIMADARILRKRYGRIFLDSLPACKNFFGPTEEILTDIAAFLQE